MSPITRQDDPYVHRDELPTADKLHLTTSLTCTVGIRTHASGTGRTQFVALKTEPLCPKFAGSQPLISWYRHFDCVAIRPSRSIIGRASLWGCARSCSAAGKMSTEDLSACNRRVPIATMLQKPLQNISVLQSLMHVSTSKGCATVSRKLGPSSPGWASGITLWRKEFVAVADPA